jgi:hypothetical protein
VLNIRGLNDKDKWDPIRNKIEESCANIFCLQETKREAIVLQFIQNFAPKIFDKFDFCPSVGASGVSSSTGPPITSRLVLLRNVPFQSISKMLSTTLKYLAILLWCMVLVDNLLEISLLIGFLTCKLRMMSFGCSWGTLIFIDTLRTEIK